MHENGEAFLDITAIMGGKEMRKEVEIWKRFEYRVKVPVTQQFGSKITFSATFYNDKEKVGCSGFYDGNDEYVIRFMPQTEGTWQFYTQSNHDSLNQLSGEFQCTAASKENHGPVEVKHTYHFSYRDGSPYTPFGTTCYVWTHQSKELEETTLNTLKNHSFNKIRMCIFPKYYTYNETDPTIYPFLGSRASGFDFTQFNPAYFQHLEEKIDELDSLGIQADIILFHPYDNGRWGFDRMTNEQNETYVKYVVARLSAFKNVWFSIANEYDLMDNFSLSDWENYIKIVHVEDPYQHLLSIHNCMDFFNPKSPYISHASLQKSRLKEIGEWREQYKKPIVVDECGYEGDIEFIWGNITEQEMVYRIWEGFLRGGYVGHSETYLHPQDILWWAKGGELHGKSPERIAFLKELFEELPIDYRNPVSFEPAWERHACIGKEGVFYFVYFGIYRPAKKRLHLAEGVKYTIDIIDTWNMEIISTDRIYQSTDEIELPGRPYIALRIVRQDVNKNNSEEI